MDSLLGKKLLILTAHPDDESFAAGGTIYLNKQKGGTSFLACATHGEHGRANLEKDIGDEEFKTLRHQELIKAAEELGINMINILNFPDRELAKNKAKLLLTWRGLIKVVAPDIILGFGSDGYTGHLDHISTASIGHKLAREFNIPYYAFSLPGGEHHHSFEGSLQKKRAHGVYSEGCSHKEPDITVEVDPELKLRVLKTYGSQFKSLDPYTIFSKEDADHFLRYEYFVKL